MITGRITGMTATDAWALSCAARVMQQLGEEEAALRLDIMARKAAATLRNGERANGTDRWRLEGTKIWRDMPTTLMREPKT